MDDESNEDEDGEENEEEAVLPKRALDPCAPTAAEVEAHQATHLPFRSWCTHCVRGRRDNLPHRRIPGDDREIPEISMEYCFLRKRSEAQTQTILIMKDRGSKAIQAWLLKNTGTSTDEPAELALEGVKNLGYLNRVYVKVDNEEALESVREELMRKLPQAALPIDPPAYESASSGMIECGVKILKGVIRVHLSALEAKINGMIPRSHPIFSWLVRYYHEIHERRRRAHGL